jgi:hypothetical protein
MQVFGEWKYIFIVYIVMQMQSHICGALEKDFSWLNPNVISIAYAIVKSPQNELSSCCMTFAYEYRKCFTFVMLVSNWMVSFGNFIVVGLLESYIMECTCLVWMLFGLKFNISVYENMLKTIG